MADRIHGFHIFKAGILEDQFIDEGAMQRDVDIFVDGRGNEKAAIFLVIRGEVCPAPAKRNAQR